MKDALAKGAQVGSAECAVTQERCGDALTRAERTLAEILADVLRADRLSVDSHFFEELGADSLVMAKFCARVRKRDDLARSEEHTSELQSLAYLVCRLLLEKKKKAIDAAAWPS